MSCNHCNTKFNFFHKEMGCANCGLSFCNKCLKQKCKIPNKGAAEQNVCRTCYAKITNGNYSSDTKIIPPDTFLKRLESLENPVAPPITMYKHDQKLQNLRQGLTPADQVLVDRLEKLKEDKTKASPPSEGELRKRLANLKGENDYVEGPSKTLYSPDTRTDQEKVDSLLEQFMEKRDIELSHNPQEEIEVRLAALREQGVRPNEGAFLSNLHDSSGSEEGVDKITKKIMDEVALDEKCGGELSKKSSKESSDDNNDDLDNPRSSSPELPWCVLCNKDARFRCLDCSNDLYCAECNQEVHKTFGDEDHKVVPYKPGTK